MNTCWSRTALVYNWRGLITHSLIFTCILELMTSFLPLAHHKMLFTTSSPNWKLNLCLALTKPSGTYKHICINLQTWIAWNDWTTRWCSVLDQLQHVLPAEGATMQCNGNQCTGCEEAERKELCKVCRNHTIVPVCPWYPLIGYMIN